MTGQTPDSAMARFRLEAERKLKDALIFAEISKLEKLDVTDADYDAAYQRYAVIYGQTPESMRNVISKAQLQIPLLNDKVLDFLIAHQPSHGDEKAAKKATKVEGAHVQAAPADAHEREGKKHAPAAEAEHHEKAREVHKAESTKVRKAESTKAHKKPSAEATKTIKHKDDHDK